MMLADSDGKLSGGATAPGSGKNPKSAELGKGRKRAKAASGVPDLDGADADPSASGIDPAAFRRRLNSWYGSHARDLPWRGDSDPYHIWVSEIMLQQTRVAAVIEHYKEFLRRFPTLLSLALAPEADVLAAWSGLGYYRRARMLHKAAQFLMIEREGRLPASSAELRTLPGVGDYTAAAIASIAFGEAVAVIDGNVERVILRLTGRPSDASAPNSAEARNFIRVQAQALVPHAPLLSAQLDEHFVSERPARAVTSGWDASERIALAASAHPTVRFGDGPSFQPIRNAAGDHNQAMMELGATICLPRNPLCLQCPVYAVCRTRGEHLTPRRNPQRSQAVAFLLDLRKQGPATEVLLERRPSDASMMPAMYELPPLPLEAVEGREPVLRVRHAITNTNYYVQVFAPNHAGVWRVEEGAEEVVAKSKGVLQRLKPDGNRSVYGIRSLRSGQAVESLPLSKTKEPLRRAIPASAKDLHWTRTSRLAGLPLTGLTRKILQRLRVMDNPRLALLE